MRTNLFRRGTCSVRVSIVGVTQIDGHRMLNTRGSTLVYYLLRVRRSLARRLASPNTEIQQT